MTAFGYTLMTEEHPPTALVRNAVAAEEAGFDFLVMSDHFHPWLEVQGQSPFAWTVWGAVAERTERVGLVSMVTCPIRRYHPAIVAQAAATVALLSGGRFSLGVGAGEKLNEHVVGGGWPSPWERHLMLEEALEIIRLAWTGEWHTYDGDYFTLDSAKLYSAPPEPPPILVAVGGEEAAALAAKAGDGMIATEPKAELVKAYHEAGGSGPVYGQVALCFDEDDERALQTATERWRFAVGGWPVQSELPAPSNFDAATAHVRPEDMASLVGHGPDPGVHAAAVEQFVEAGFSHVAVVQIGREQERFLRFWQDQLRPRLGS